jgi:hypothetical protein
MEESINIGKKRLPQIAAEKCNVEDHCGHPENIPRCADLPQMWEPPDGAFRNSPPTG